HPPGVLWGREHELEALLGQVDAGRRLITILGPGGIGKSRLAIAVAHRLARARPDTELRWLDLGRTTDDDGLTGAMAAALGVDLSNGGDQGAARIEHALGSRGPIIIILDEVEHAVAVAGRWVSRWLRAAQGVSVI